MNQGGAPIFRIVKIQFRIGSFNKWILFLNIPIVFFLFLEPFITANVQANYSSSLLKLSSRSQAPQVTGAQKTQAVEVLEQGRPSERALAAGEINAYKITLAEGDFLKLEVEQRGIDVVVRVIGPDGKQISECNYEPRKQGVEKVSQVAEVTGGYQIIIEPAQRVAPAGRYAIRVVEVRAAKESDRQLQEAQELGAESLRLYHAGRYDEALPLAERALEIRIREQGREHLDVAQSLNLLANIYSGKGDYAKAETLHQRALDIRLNALGPDHPLVARSLNNLAVIYYDKGDYAKSERLHQRTLAIRENALGPEHPDVARSLNNLALIYYDKGEYAKAEPLNQRALAIWEKTMGPEHLEVARSLNILADIYRAKRDYAKAAPLYLRALAIREKTLGSEHPDVATSLTTLANLYHEIGDYEKAELLYHRALSIREKTLGPEHPFTAWTLNDLSALYAARGEISNAVAYQARAIGISERNISYNLRTGSERQKLAYLAALSAHVSQTISLHVRYAPADPVAASLAATMILQRKGRTLDAMSGSLAALRQRSKPEDKALLDRLNEITAQLARLVFGGPKRTDPAEHQKQIKELEEQKEKLEAEISGRSAEFRAQSQAITRAAVQAAIPTNAVLIEFASYRPFNAKVVGNDRAYDEPHYVAYLLRREGEVEWRELGDAKTIDAAIDAFRKALSDPKRQDVKKVARSLDEKVMQPLRAMIGGATQLLVSPDGALNLIPFEALADEQNRYLIERYSFTYLTSGRDLLRLQVERESKSSPLIVADPQFGEWEQLAQFKLSQLAKTVAPRRNPPRIKFRQTITTGSDLASVYFAQLMGTELEAREIKALFPEARVLLGEEATETSLKRAVAPRILHIATHGFFLTDWPVKLEGTRGLSLMREDGGLGGQIEDVKLENPLLRSGLALAGANLRTGREDDGILTALEASGLNLWGTQLVVLSACDTGIGEVRTGEGVNGLRRALVLAGSETQVMSLWQVSDYATYKLMKAFYTELKQGQGRGEALRSVKLETMRLKGTEHPYYWASFIQSGKWTPLTNNKD